MSTTQHVRSLSVFFPAYYDEKNISILVPEAIKVLKKLNLDAFEIIIIEDGSPDNTGQVADQLSTKFDEVRTIHHPHNMGYGATLKDGFKNAKYDWIFYTDGDNQFDIHELRKFVALIPNADIVIGFRNHKQHSVMHKFISFCYNTLIRYLFNLKVKDVNCAFKLFPRTFINQISITSRHGFIDAEILLKANQLDYKITQVKVTHRPRLHGLATASRPSVILGTIYETFSWWLKQK